MMDVLEFKKKCDEAESMLGLDERLIIKPMDFDVNTGEILREGAVYRVKDKNPGCGYRTQDNPIDANLDIEQSKGVSCADFSDYVDNRDVIRKLMAVSNGKNAMTMRRYVSGLGVDDGFSDGDMDEDFDLDEIDDLEQLTMTDYVNQQAQQYQQQQNNKSKQDKPSDEEAKQSGADEKQGESSAE